MTEAGNGEGQATYGDQIVKRTRHRSINMSIRIVYDRPTFIGKSSEAEWSNNLPTLVTFGGKGLDPQLQN